MKKRRLTSVLTLILVLMLSVSAVNVHAETSSDEPEKCTGVYVGRAVSADDTMIIARSEDQSRGAYNKMFFVQPATGSSGGKITDTTARWTATSSTISTPIARES